MTEATTTTEATKKKQHYDNVIDVDTMGPPSAVLSDVPSPPSVEDDVMVMLRGNDNDVRATVDVEAASALAAKNEDAVVLVPSSSSPLTGRAAVESRQNVDARLHWESVNLAVQKSDGSHTQILDGVWGESPQGQISAIMGPSGSGKTSLLNVLSGRMSNATHNVTVQANNVTWNGRPLEVTDLTTRQTIAFVAQDDSLPVTSTPREAILFSARLRLDKNLTMTELHEITDTMLRQLHLEQCADTFVGGALLKGISGGERKRTSVGVELVCRPKLIFLDEPTSGLDSFNALELVQVLKQVAATGSAVMLTIHQPSTEIWELFDRLTLLKGGRVMYEGKRDGVPSKFANCGYALPPNYNPADWVMNIAQSVQTEDLVQAGFFPVNDFSTHYTTKSSGDDNDNDTSTAFSVLNHSATMDHRVGFVTQTQWLLSREMAHFSRNTHPLKTRTMMTLMISLLCGILFWQAAQESFTEYVNLQTAFGALLLALMGNIFSTALPAIVAFPEERPVFVREYSAGLYTVPAYFVSRFAMEVLVTAVQVTFSTMITYLMVGFSQPYGTFWSATYAMALTSTALGVMVGSSVSDPSVAIEFLPAVFMPQILFAGFFIPKESMPVWLAWLTYVFPLTYAVRLVLVYEFEDCNESTMSQMLCDNLLNNVDANPDEMWWYWIVLFAQFVFFRLLALFVLQRKAERFY